MQFGTKGVEADSKESKFVGFGINDVTIKSVGVSDDKKAITIEMYLKGTSGEETTTKYIAFTHDDPSRAEAAFERAKLKIRHIQTKLMSEEAADALEAPTVEEYAAKLNRAFQGKSLRIKLSGRQYRNAAGEVKWFVDFPLPYGGGFAEPIEDNGQAIPAVLNPAETALTFSKEQIPGKVNYDFQPLEEESDNTSENKEEDVWS